MRINDIIKYICRLLPDKVYIALLFRIKMGYKLDLKNPKTYNEKLQWTKLYDKNPLYPIIVDKYLVKNYVEKKIGSQYIIPTLGNWTSFREIDFDKLPKQFVLKCNHDSGGIVICKNRKTFNMNAAKEKLEKSLKHSYYWDGREWPYSKVKPMIIAEPYMEDKRTNELRDYKFFCFGGVPRMLFVATDRQNKDLETKFDFFDMNFQHLDIRNGHENADSIPEKPASFDKMKELAKCLSEDFSHVRVDFYEVNGQIYFGELTLFHWSGFMKIEPIEWDFKMGNWFELKTNKSVRREG